MKTIYQIFYMTFLSLITLACNNDLTEKEENHASQLQLPKFHNKIKVDSTYTYPGDELYQTLASSYANGPQNIPLSRTLSPEDDAFFNRTHIVKSTEATLLYGRNYIYPGAILEGNSISDQQYVPIFVTQRNPITVSMTLNHNTAKPTSRTINNPTNSKLSDYVKEMVTDGNFEQSQKFMFQYKRFSFYDEIKSAFGTNINTRKLFSSRKESSNTEEEKIMKSAGMYVKFFQSSFTVNMDIAPLSNFTITGKSGYEPVYVSSVTYGRMGILVFETDETYEFAETCIKKEFDRIFYHKTVTQTEEERLFFENTEFKVLLLGADSDYAVQTIKGYGHFLNLIYHSQFDEHNYGVPITCSFTYANTHGLVETEFENKIYIEPLYVQTERVKTSSSSGRENGEYYYSHSFYLNFYKDRNKTKVAIPTPDIIFSINHITSTCKYTPDYSHWPMIMMDYKREDENITIRNISYKSRIYVGTETAYYTSTGKTPSKPMEPMYHWEATEYNSHYYLESSPFFITIN